MTMLFVLIAFASFALALWATLPAATVLARTGITISGAMPTAAALTDKFGNNGKQYLLVYNGSGSTRTLTITSQETVDGLAVADPTVSIPTLTSMLIGPFKPSVYNDASGYVNIAIDVITTVTYQVVQADNVIGQ